MSDEGIVMQRAAHWWLHRQAKRLGVNPDDLIHVCETAGRLEARQQEVWRCEGCGRVIHDFQRDDAPRCRYVTDEDGIRVCENCWGPYA